MQQLISLDVLTLKTAQDKPELSTGQLPGAEPQPGEIDQFEQLLNEEMTASSASLAQLNRAREQLGNPQAMQDAMKQQVVSVPDSDSPADSEESETAVAQLITDNLATGESQAPIERGEQGAEGVATKAESSSAQYPQHPSQSLAEDVANSRVDVETDYGASASENQATTLKSEPDPNDATNDDFLAMMARFDQAKLDVEVPPDNEENVRHVSDLILESETAEAGEGAKNDAVQTPQPVTDDVANVAHVPIETTNKESAELGTNQQDQIQSGNEQSAKRQVEHVTQTTEAQNQQLDQVIKVASGDAELAAQTAKQESDTGTDKAGVQHGIAAQASGLSAVNTGQDAGQRVQQSSQQSAQQTAATDDPRLKTDATQKDAAQLKAETPIEMQQTPLDDSSTKPQILPDANKAAVNDKASQAQAQVQTQTQTKTSEPGDQHTTTQQDVQPTAEMEAVTIDAEVAASVVAQPSQDVDAKAKTTSANDGKSAVTSVDANPAKQNADAEHIAIATNPVTTSQVAESAAPVTRSADTTMAKGAESAVTKETAAAVKAELANPASANDEQTSDQQQSESGQQRQRAESWQLAADRTDNTGFKPLGEARAVTSSAEATFSQALQQAELAEKEDVKIKAQLEQLNKDALNLNKQEFAGKMRERMLLMVAGKIQQAEIKLDPAELGSINVRVQVQGDQTTIAFSVQQQQTRDALESSMPKLREMLEQQGLQLGESHVEQQGQQEFAERGEGSQGEAEQEADAEEMTHVASKVVDLSPGRVDFYA